MMKKPIIFETSDLRKLRELIEDHVEYNGGMTEFEDILEDFDCKYVLNNNFENFKGQVKDFVNDINDSKQIEKLIDSLAGFGKALILTFDKETAFTEAGTEPENASSSTNIIEPAWAAIKFFDD